MNNALLLLTAFCITCLSCSKGPDVYLVPVDESANTVELSIVKNNHVEYRIDIPLALSEKIDYYVPLYARDGQVSTQYTMTILERLGLLKIDFLGLRNLTIIDHCCKSIKKNNPSFDINSIPIDDQAVFDMREHACLVARLALGRDHDLIPYVFQGETELFLAVGIGVGRVEIADAALVGRADQLYAVIHVAALHGQAAHRSLGDRQPGRAERDFFHGNTLSFCNYLYHYTKSPEACKAI